MSTTRHKSTTTTGSADVPFEMVFKSPAGLAAPTADDALTIANAVKTAYAGTSAPPLDKFSMVAESSQAQKTKIRVLGSFSEGLSNTMFGYDIFKAKLEEMSNNTIELEFTDAATLTDPNGDPENTIAVMEAAARGDYDAVLTDIAYGNAAYLQNLTWNGTPVREMKKSISLLANARPFGMAADKFKALCDENDAMIQAEVAKYNLVSILFASTAGQITGYLRTPQDVADFTADPLAFYNGKSLRVGGLSALVFQELGATTTVVPGSLIAAGLAGQLEGYEAVTPFDQVEFVNPKIDIHPNIGLPGSAAGVIPTTWGESANCACLVFNQPFHDALAPEIKAMIRAAASQCYSAMVSKHLVDSKAAFESTYQPLVDAGTLALIDLSTLTTTRNGPSEAALDALYSIWQPIQNDDPGDDPFWKQFTDLYEARKAVHASWTDQFVEKSGVIAG